MQGGSGLNKQNGLIKFFPIVLVIFLFFAKATSAGASRPVDVSGIAEGWSWPVVVLSPPNGWESVQGRSIKFAMRLAERGISIERAGIAGKEVTFMFASPVNSDNLKQRLEQWRRMGVYLIISFAGGSIENEINRLCASVGPSVIFSSGSEQRLIGENMKPHSYLFALDLPFYSRANAFVARAQVAKTRQSTIYSDILAKRLAQGAVNTRDLMRKNGINSDVLWIPAYKMDQFSIPTGEAIASGATVHVSWLDGMATLSLWKKIEPHRSPMKLWYAGRAHNMLLDADGLLLVDPDQPIKSDVDGRRRLSLLVRDYFNHSLSDEIDGAKAYTLARWGIDAYKRAKQTTNNESISVALSQSSNIPLLNDMISIDPRTHRPKTRKLGFLKIKNRAYIDDGNVTVESFSVREI